MQKLGKSSQEKIVDDLLPSKLSFFGYFIVIRIQLWVSNYVTPSYKATFNKRCLCTSDPFPMMAFSSESSSRKVLYSSVRCMLVWKLINYEQKICPETVSSTLLENEGSSGFPNTRKLVKARGRRPSIRAFIVFEYSRLRNKRNWKYSRIFSHVTNQSYVVIQTKK